MNTKRFYFYIVHSISLLSLLPVTDLLLLLLVAVSFLFTCDLRYLLNGIPNYGKNKTKISEEAKINEWTNAHFKRPISNELKGNFLFTLSDLMSSQKTPKKKKKKMQLFAWRIFTEFNRIFCVFFFMFQININSFTTIILDYMFVLYKPFLWLKW